MESVKSKGRLREKFAEETGLDADINSGAYTAWLESYAVGNAPSKADSICKIVETDIGGPEDEN